MSRSGLRIKHRIIVGTHLPVSLIITSMLRAIDKTHLILTDVSSLAQGTCNVIVPDRYLPENTSNISITNEELGQMTSFDIKDYRHLTIS
jgi:hypothetical protein